MGEHGLPLIIPTPCGYRFARGIDKFLRQTYLPKRIQDAANVNLWVPTIVTVFGDSDHVIHLDRHIRGRDVYIVADVENHGVPCPNFNGDAPTGYTINMEKACAVKDKKGEEMPIAYRKLPIAQNFDILCATVEAARNAVKKRGFITVVLPCFPSARQDRRHGRKSLDLKRRCAALEQAGADHIITIDIHNDATELAFNPDTGFDHLYAAHTFLTYLRENRYDLKNGFFVAPDAGAFERNLMYAEALSVPVAFIYKHRQRDKINTVTGTFGFGGNTSQIEGKDVYIVDDIIDSGGTLINGASFLKSHGAKSVTAIATHPVFSHPAIERLGKAVEDGVLKEVIVSNSISLKDEIIEGCPWLTVVDIYKYFAKAIDRLNRGMSISQLLREVGD